MDGRYSLSDLLCTEDFSCFLDDEELVHEDNIADNSPLPEMEEIVYEDYIALYDEDCVRMFFDKEMSFGFKKNASSELSGCLKRARLEAIASTLKTRAILGLHFQTAYVSVMYFDRYISKIYVDTVESQEMQLVTMTCLFLAAKMEESEKKFPTISRFRTAECNFQSQDIRRMEVLILNTLEWEMISITPFDFLHFLVTKLCKEFSQDHLSEAARLILAVMREINLMEYRPSVIAAAAILRTMDQNLTREVFESAMNSVSNTPFLELEDVFACYGLMQKLDVTKLDIPQSGTSTGLSPAYLNALLDDSPSSAACAKRKGLIFIRSDNRHGGANKKRRC